MLARRAGRREQGAPHNMDNPIVRRFQNYIDGQKIDDWYEARGHVRKGKEPRFGFIASVDGVDAAPNNR